MKRCESWTQGKKNWTLKANKLDEKSEIGKKIWQEAENKGLTKAAFSKKMNISRQTLDNWIDGTSPTYDQVQKASKILGVQFGQSRSFKDEIFEGDYIGMHKRVFALLEGGITNDRKLLLDLASTLKNLSSSNGN